ncbi:hypothetical protein [Pseudomonas sp. RIT-PI-AD]|uniref:hypothetical protein n=1 Tax=Pseudomonas sp. RIT-PI-AD TaxID=3035294 RepID=UPI0021DAB547|nr:hypothetical protein [Pseudomonas sp. RIT-PI-AD]
MNVSRSLALAAALGLPCAGAVELSVGGQGQALIYPIYSVESGNDTAIHVTNGALDPSIVKVRLLEGVGGQVAHSFNLYLGGHDVWTGVLTRSADGVRLITADTSCTLPRLPAEGVELGAAADPALAPRTRVGIVEVIEMGSLDPAVEYSEWKQLNEFFSGGNCGGLSGAFDAGGPWALDRHYGLKPPRGHLSGSVTLTNVMNGHQIAVEASALNEFSQNVRQTRPEDPEPTLGQSETSYATMRGTVIPFRNGVEAVTALLTRPSAEGDFAYGAGLNAETDWVVTFPTKAYLNALTTSDMAGERHSPFVTTPDENGLTCERVDTLLASREGERESSDRINLCAITNIIGLGDSDILGGQYVRTRLPAPKYDTGWLELTLSGYDDTSEWSSYKRNLMPIDPPAPFELKGLGMIGLSLTRIQNGDVGGLLSNYMSAKRLTSPTDPY